MSHLQADHIRKRRMDRNAWAFAGKVARENAAYDAEHGGAIVTPKVSTGDPSIPAPWEGEECDWSACRPSRKPAALNRVHNDGTPRLPGERQPDTPRAVDARPEKPTGMRSSMANALERDAILRDLERIYEALEWIDDPNASYARRLASRLGARLRGEPGE